MQIFTRLLLAATVAALLSSWAMAQDRSDDTNAKSDVRTLTGCLTKAGGGDEYQLTTRDGSTWEIHSDKSAVNLSDHVNHTVKVTGVVSNAMAHNMKEDAKDTAHDAHMGNEKPEHGHLKVTNLRMVRESCSE
jgi:hypothetical protein